MVILFGSALLSAYKSGRNAAQSKLTVETVRVLQQGLDYFYNDQSRYPSSSEFENSELMKEYFDNFPPRTFSYTSCPESIQYTAYRQVSFAIDFCIPRNHGAFTQGANRVTEKTPLIKISK